MNQRLAGKNTRLKDLHIDPRRPRTAGISLVLAACLVLGLGLGASQVDAFPFIIPTNLDPITLGVNQGNGITNPFLGTVLENGQAVVKEVGNLQGEVYLNAGLYTYVLTVTPYYPDVQTFQTDLGLTGIGDNAVGYSFGDAGALAFDILFLEDPNLGGLLEWDISTGSWEANRSIRFFLQSTFGPFGSGTYTIIDGVQASAVSNAPIPGAPVPEPGTLLLLGSGLVGTMGMLRSRKRSQNQGCPEQKKPT